MEQLGRRRWAIAEGYLPEGGTNRGKALSSHETACLLNAGARDAHVRITVFFETRGPAGPYEIAVPAGRTKHVRFDDLEKPERIPRGTDYASVIESDEPIVVQHTRLDGRLGGIALVSTIAFSE